MHKLTKEELPAIAPLFEGVQETMVWSCLQGLMGEAYAEEETPPACAQLLLGDFCFFGGDARAAGGGGAGGAHPSLAAGGTARRSLGGPHRAEKPGAVRARRAIRL